MTGKNTDPVYRDFWMPHSKSFAKEAFSNLDCIKRYPVGELGWKKQNGILNADSSIIMLKNLFQMNGT